jgi:hypothetical protein
MATEKEKWSKHLRRDQPLVSHQFVLSTRVPRTVPASNPQLDAEMQVSTGPGQVMR